LEGDIEHRAFVGLLPPNAGADSALADLVDGVVLGLSGNDWVFHGVFLAILDGIGPMATLFGGGLKWWGVSALDNNQGPEKLRESMKEPRRLTPEELSRIAADPQAALLALAGSAGARAAIRNLGRKDDSTPKKRRKKSAAWQAMIAVIEKARREKGVAS
jgi:hypothetical protein